MNKFFRKFSPEILTVFTFAAVSFMLLAPIITSARACTDYSRFAANSVLRMNKFVTLRNKIPSHAQMVQPIFSSFNKLLMATNRQIALSARSNLLSRIHEASELMKSDQFLSAIQMLNEASLLEGTGFHLLPTELRKNMASEVSVVFGDVSLTDKDFILALGQEDGHNPGVHTDGLVSIMNPPVLNHRNYLKYRWVQIEWLLVTIEEYGHVA